MTLFQIQTAIWDPMEEVSHRIPLIKLRILLEKKKKREKKKRNIKREPWKWRF